MPIEIKELVIRAQVSETRNVPAQAGSGENLAELKQDIISECVDKVMEIINRQKAR